jgi:hypothetical protein
MIEEFSQAVCLVAHSGAAVVNSYEPWIWWPTVVALMGAAATISIAILAWVQLHEAKKLRSADIYLRIDEMVKGIREDRLALYDLSNDCRKWTQEEKELAHRVTMVFQRAAFLADQRLIDEKYLIESYGQVFVDVWRNVEAFIKDYREETGEPSQRIHLERFAKKCKDKLGLYRRG